MLELATRRWGRWILFILGWAALTLLFAPETYLSFYLRDAPMTWRETLELTLANSSVALLFIPAIVRLTRLFPVERGKLGAALWIHIPACLAFSVGHSGLYAVICHAWNEVGGTLFYRFHPNLLSYWAVVGFTQAHRYFEQYQERERQVAQLQLEVLKSQLHPHFLFNTLHTISAMMHEDVRSADRMLARLSDLLRMILNGIDRQEVRLAEELAFVRTYLQIERVRFGERLETRIDADDDTLDALAPALFLQPLVENCLRHGLVPQQPDSLISITARRDGDQLVLSIADNGRGLGASVVQERLGIGNTRKRLDQLYARRSSFVIEPAAPRGCVVTARFPYHTASADAPAAAAERYDRALPA